MSKVTFTFPDDCGGGELVLREPTTQIEIDAEKAAKLHDSGEEGRAQELLKRCIVSALGKPMDWSTGNPEKLMDELGEKRRQLAMAAFNKAFMPTKEQKDAFLATMKMEVSE